MLDKVNYYRVIDTMFFFSAFLYIFSIISVDRPVSRVPRVKSAHVSRQMTTAVNGIQEMQKSLGQHQQLDLGPGNTPGNITGLVRYKHL